MGTMSSLFSTFLFVGLVAGFSVTSFNLFSAEGFQNSDQDVCTLEQFRKTPLKRLSPSDPTEIHSERVFWNRNNICGALSRYLTTKKRHWAPIWKPVRYIFCEVVFCVLNLSPNFWILSFVLPLSFSWVFSRISQIFLLGTISNRTSCIYNEPDHYENWNDFLLTEKRMIKHLETREKNLIIGYMKLESVLGKIKKSPHPAKLESCSKSFFPTSFESFQRGTLQHGRSMMEISNFEIFPNSNSPIFLTKLSNFMNCLYL